MKQKKSWLRLTIVFSVLAVLSLVYLVLAMFVFDFLKGNKLAITVGNMVFAILLVLMVVSSTQYLAAVNQEKVLLQENEYNLGEATLFYNYPSFTKRVAKLLKKHKSDNPAYICYFSASSLQLMLNAGRNLDVTTLNKNIAHYLTNYFGDLNSRQSENIAFCFYHGCFLLAFFGTETELTNIRISITTEIYNIVDRERLKIFVYPFFGVTIYNSEESLFTNIDDAVTARNVCEKQFNEVMFYSPSFRRAPSKAEVDELQNALNNDEMVVYYQPKYHLGSKTYNSAEALVRWNSKVYGIRTPGQFLGKAEMGGLIHDIDMFVFRRVCEDLADQKKRGRRLLPVSVNFTPYGFYSQTFLSDISAIMKEFNIDPYLIEIEITEAISQRNLFVSGEILKKLKKQGIKLAMDDFGVGYSNLSNLNKMPFDTVKIDKTYIDNIVYDIKAREIVKLLISVCHANGIEVVAEGVEKAEQVEILRRLKCDTIQGYFFSTPLTKIEYEKRISKAFQALDKEED